SATCSVKPISSPPINEKIDTLEVRVVTADSLFAGTDRDVWIDIGPKAWKLPGDFPRGSTRTMQLSPSEIADGSGLTPNSVPLFLDDIRFLRVEKKGIGMADIPALTPELLAIQKSGMAQRIGGLTNAPDSVAEAIAPSSITPQALFDDAQ